MNINQQLGYQIPILQMMTQGNKFDDRSVQELAPTNKSEARSMIDRLVKAGWLVRDARDGFCQVTDLGRTRIGETLKQRGMG